jgi:AcrR family transcriptional regulator
MDHKIRPEPLTTPMDARMVRTRDALRGALLVLLEQKPFDQITIRDIAAQSGTGYATFFRHYHDKGALLNDLAADQIGALLNLALPVLQQTDSSAAARMLCAYVDARRKLWSALLTGGAAGILREEFVRQAGRLAVARSEPGSWLPNDLRVIFGVSATVEILAWWLKSRNDIPIEQVATILDRLVIAPTWKTE